METLTGTYNSYLVLISIFVAILASYAALNMATRFMKSQEAGEQRVLFGTSTISMGLGIWLMHFLGMFAFSLPVQMGYNLTITIVSILPALAGSALALYLIIYTKMDRKSILFSAVTMGLGIALMHYLGMAGLEMRAIIIYQPLLVILSILIAIITSLVAIIIIYRIRQNLLRPKFTVKTMTATIMGGAIAGMHYTGMAAARFKPDYDRVVEIRDNEVIILMSIVAVSFLIIITSITNYSFDD
jgi:NO-binding membrane sensor protein with MHYT domain